METSFIHWQEFLDVLRERNPPQLQLWLRRWLFTDEGVILADHRVPSVHS